MDYNDKIARAIHEQFDKMFNKAGKEGSEDNGITDTTDTTPTTPTTTTTVDTTHTTHVDNVTNINSVGQTNIFNGDIEACDGSNYSVANVNSDDSKEIGDDLSDRYSGDNLWYRRGTDIDIDWEVYDERVEVIYANERVQAAFNRHSKGSAGYDLCINSDRPITIKPGKDLLISTGIRIWLRNPRLVGKCYPRSGLGCRGLVLKNLVGVIDSDYQGEIKLCLWNTSASSITLNPYERVGQLVIEWLPMINVVGVNSFSSSTERGEKGFGSTGL